MLFGKYLSQYLKEKDKFYKYLLQITTDQPQIWL